MPFYVSECETTGDDAHLFGSDILALTILQKLPAVPYLPLWKESTKTTPEKTKHHPKTGNKTGNKRPGTWKHLL